MEIPINKPVEKLVKNSSLERVVWTSRLDYILGIGTL